MYRQLILFVFVSALMMVSPILAGDLPEADTLMIESVETSHSGSIAVRIEFVNQSRLGALTIPIGIYHDGVLIDSISFAGSRVDYIKTKPVTITRDRRRVVFGAISMTEDYIPPGRGLLATLYLAVPDSMLGEVIIVDSTTVRPATLLFTRFDSASYTPVCKAGSVKLIDPLGMRTKKH